MPTRFLPDQQGNAELIRDLAEGLDGIAQLVQDRIKPLAPYGIGVHPPRGKVRRPFTAHYRDTIRHTTYVGGKPLHGRDVRTPTFNPGSWAIAAVVYTTFTPIGHIYEVTGAGPHDIPIPIVGGTTVAEFTVIVHHPGVSKKPHFVPGLLEARGEMGATMKGRILDQRGHG